jgi:hypothetical protein
LIVSISVADSCLLLPNESLRDAANGFSCGSAGASKLSNTRVAFILMEGGAAPERAEVFINQLSSRLRRNF